VVRQVVAPNGKHRPRRLGETALEPIEARVDDIAWCPVEEKDTLHAFLATGGRQCWTCRVVTVDPAPPGGVE
jgi:hypothetical protein